MLHLFRLGFFLVVIEIVAYHHALDDYPDTFFTGLTEVHVANSNLFSTSNFSCCFQSDINHEYPARIQRQEKLSSWEKFK